MAAEIRLLAALFIIIPTICRAQCQFLAVKMLKASVSFNTKWEY